MSKSLTHQSILENILLDFIFVKTETYKKLLSYLVDCSIKDYIPNEIDIATKVLGQNHAFDPAEDTVVRVYIYNLRKKLKESIITINGSIPQFFDMPLEVEGYDETALGTKIRYFYEIPSNFQIKKNKSLYPDK